MKILVTAGATREPLDAVRFLSNVSTGATGAALADEFVRRGHQVVLLRGEGAVSAQHANENETFSSAADLSTRLQRRLAGNNFDVVVMAAAVSDYRPSQADPGKISSSPPSLNLSLVRNEKILPRLKTFAAIRPLRVIGFKLTVGADAAARRAAIAAQFAAGGVDAVVLNDLNEIRTAPVHPFYLWSSSATAPSSRIDGVPALVAALETSWAGPSL